MPPHPPGSLVAAMQGFGHLPSMAAGLPGSMGMHPPTPLSALTAAARSPALPPSLQPPMSNMGPPVRRRLSDKGPLPMSSGKHQILSSYKIPLKFQFTSTGGPRYLRTFYLQICWFTIQNWLKMTIFYSKMDFLSVNSEFAVQNDGTYLPWIKRETCIMMSAKPVKATLYQD